jgi:phosphoribosylaminoimidazole-succinocarboxamide synthase
MSAITETNFQFPNQINFYRGKVREVYIFSDRLIMIASDRISAFDVILPKPIPHKGQVLNQLSSFWLQNTKDIIKNWWLASPDPNVSVGLKCQPLPVEMVIRGYLVGSAWRAYKNGQRNFNGNILPDNLKENDKLPFPIITPTTKAQQGEHDEDITTEEILEQKLVSKEIYQKIEKATFLLFERGQQIAEKANLILADTKYEFGILNDEVYLIDEIHTPDSARYFDKKNYTKLQEEGKPQPQRSKEMVRQWLIQNGFQGQEGQSIPDMTDEWRNQISKEYIALYEEITQQKFVPVLVENRLEMLKNNIQNYVQQN